MCIHCNPATCDDTNMYMNVLIKNEFKKNDDIKRKKDNDQVLPLAQ